MKPIPGTRRKSPGFPEATALAMILGVVVPCWLSEGAGWALAYAVAVTAIGYGWLRVDQAKHSE
ncbi:MAG TPA: hypothetical protein VHH73_16910 [Verrucomicrobiae bacterium]|nr:hypothetical protein [Verrucomicrobiae bacterium]